MLYSILNAHFCDIRVEPVSAEMIESSINNAKPSNHSTAMDISVFLIDLLSSHTRRLQESLSLFSQTLWNKYPNTDLNIMICSRKCQYGVRAIEGFLIKNTLMTYLKPIS